ncbi:hypothetical protein EI555_020243, partial [Monodon monoceros]
TFWLRMEGMVEEAPMSPNQTADETDDLEGHVSTTGRVMMMTSRAIDWSHLPKLPPYTAFLGNLPYDVTEDSIKEFFRGLNISAVCLLGEPSNPERLKSLGYAEFEDLGSLLSAPSLSEEFLGNRRIQVDVADHAQAETEIRILKKQIQIGGPLCCSFDGYPPRTGDEGLETNIEIVIIQTDSVTGHGSIWSQDCYDHGAAGITIEAAMPGWAVAEEHLVVSTIGPKLNLKPRSTPKEDDSSASMSQSSRAASLFGGGKPVGTTAREQEQEKLRHQLDEPKLEQRPLERYPSWQSEETQEWEWSRTGSESSRTGTSATSGRNARRRKSEKSLENETPNKEENCPSLTSKPPKPEQPLKVMPAPPSKENAWEGPVRKDENRVDGVSVPKDQSGNSSRGPGNGRNRDHWKGSERKDGKKDQDARSAPETKKTEEYPASKFSSARKYAALTIDGENEGDDNTK